jgi:hypothetical protein
MVNTKEARRFFRKAPLGAFRISDGLQDVLSVRQKFPYGLPEGKVLTPTMICWHGCSLMEAFHREFESWLLTRLW